MRKDNKGFSLIELLVAIAIMAIVTGIATLSYNVVRKADVKKSAQVLDSMLTSVRTNNLSQASKSYLYIYLDSSDECFYYKISNTLTTNPGGLSDEAVYLCADSITLKCKFSDSTSRTVQTGNTVAFTFDKSTGALIMYYNATTPYSSTLTGIEFSRGSKTSKITIASETGKHFIDG